VNKKEKEEAARVAAGQQIVKEALKRDAVALELAAKTIFRKGVR